MNCNCNNNNTMKEAKIKHVFGNVLRVAIPLTLRTVELVEVEIDGETKQQAEATDTDFIPSSDYPVLVVFSKGAVKVSLKAQMRDGNVAYVEDKGSIPVGLYDITVTCNDNNGNPYRFKQNTTLQVVDTTAEAGIVTPIEYEVITWYLDAAIYLALKGEDGVGIEDIETQSSGEIGGVNTVTFILTDGRTRSFNILNGSGATDSELDINSHSPIANSAVTAKFNELSGELADLFGDVDYDTSSKSIRFWDKGKTNVLASLDARPFIKDGMVSNAYISNNTLVITFNTDSGKEAIGVPLTSVFNPNNYYTKTQVDSRIASAVANINLSNYYTKTQVDTLYSSLSSRVTPVEVIFTYSYNSITSNKTVNGIYTDYTNKKPIIGRYGNSVGTLLYISSQEAAFLFGDRYDNPFILRNSDSTHWGKDDLVDFSSFIDYEPIPESENAVSSGGVWDYLAQRIQSVTINGTTKTPDENGDVSFTVQGGGGYEPPVGGIPKSDLAQSVQDTLDDVSNKVDKVAGKGLSTEDYTTAEKQKLAGLNNYDDTAIQADVDSKYEKPSTGIPKSDLASDVQASLGKADTALQSSDLERYATTDDVDNAVAALVSSAPQTLDTLKELADALGDDPNFATTMATQLGNKVDKETGKGLSTNDYTTAEKTKLAGLENYDDSALQTAVAGKVDKESGKSLMSDAEHTKLRGIAAGAEVNVQPNWTQTNTSADDYIKNKPDLSTFATKTEVNAKQDAISDLATIRSGAALGATAAQPADIPTKVSDLTNDAGYTTNTGTVTGISVNGGTAQQPTNGVVNLTVATGGDNDIVGISDGTAGDGAVIFTKRNGDTITLNLNHVHSQYLKYELLADEAAYTALATKDSSTLYLIPES